MKILHFYKTYYPDSYGGVEQFIYQLTEGNKSDDVQTSVLSLSSEPEVNAIELSRSKSVKAKKMIEISSTPFSVDAIIKFKRMASEADIIHYHFPYPFMDIIHFILGIKKPTVVSYHSDILKQKNWLKVYRPVMRKFLSSVSSIVATSPNYVETSSTLQEFKHKISIIPIGIDSHPYLSVSQEKVEFWRDKLPPRFYLFVGALRYYKGLDILLDAMHMQNMPVVLIGSGPNELNLKRKAERLGITCIHFLGQLANEDKYAILKICYGILFPSHLRTEAFGISLLEGSILAKPLITCEIGTGTSYINIHNKTGLVVPPGDYLALRSAMLHLWNNGEVAQFYGEAARERYFELFTSDKMVDEFNNLYRNLLS